jgi:SAM-dependent methyltransferase
MAWSRERTGSASGPPAAPRNNEVNLRMNPTNSALAEQAAYYRARAAEYDEWWLRQGRYDRGPELNAAWFAEGALVAAALNVFKPRGHILELACGTGLWTQRLLPFAATLTALDASPEVLALNAARLRSERVQYVNADIFRWKPDAQFDTVFFSFWLSHVPPERFAEFWQLVRASLAPGGRVFFVDSRRDPTSTAIDNALPEQPTVTLRRRLNDGREFQIFKTFHEPKRLTAQLSELGWQFKVQETPHYFVYGAGS